MFEGVALIMRRIMLVVTVALVMAAMMVVMAAPAFADHSEGHTFGQGVKTRTEVCREGDPHRPGASDCTPALEKGQGPT
jgi:hypothetical protein